MQTGITAGSEQENSLSANRFTRNKTDTDLFVTGIRRGKSAASCWKPQTCPADCTSQADPEKPAMTFALHDPRDWMRLNGTWRKCETKSYAKTLSQPFNPGRTICLGRCLRPDSCRESCFTAWLPSGHGQGSGSFGHRVNSVPELSEEIRLISGRGKPECQAGREQTQTGKNRRDQHEKR